jgi:hypothetical protein
VNEFCRVLRKGGLFCALWNTRQIRGNPVLEDIENKILELKPDLTRVSSGSSGITSNLEQRLIECPLFGNVYYLRGHHTEYWSLERYIGAWRSVNDIQSQLGEQTFEEFIRFVKLRLSNIDFINVSYVTRAWVARKLLIDTV